MLTPPRCSLQFTRLPPKLAIRLQEFEKDRGFGSLWFLLLGFWEKQSSPRHVKFALNIGLLREKYHTEAAAASGDETLMLI